MLFGIVAAVAMGQTILDGNTQSLEVVTSSSASIDYMVSYVDYGSGTVTPSASQGNIATATTTTWVAAPAASTQRQLRRAAFRNKSTTTANTLTFQKDVSGTNYETYRVTLAPGESVRMDGEGEWQVYDSSGIQRIPATTVIDGRTLTFLKVGAASEAAGITHMLHDRTGVPGSWVPGTPGASGQTRSCNTTSDASAAGAPYLPDPASGGYYLTSATAGVSVSALPLIVDLLWYNTGLTVTTTTAQTVNSGTLPARDNEGATDGEGVYAAILVTTATTNGAAITNMTLDYTDSDGNPGNTGIITSFPATAVLGSFIPFQLAAGDRGVKSIQNVTLGTSLVTGTVSLVLYRPIAFMPSPVANVGGTINVVNAAPAGARVWNGSCLWTGYVATATTANTVQINTQLTVR
jgi:hypothetical protein